MSNTSWHEDENQGLRPFNCLTTRGIQAGKKNTELTLKDRSQHSSDESPFWIHCARSVCVCVWGVFKLRDSVWLTCWETTLQPHSCKHKRTPALWQSSIAERWQLEICFHCRDHTHWEECILNSRSPYYSLSLSISPCINLNKQPLLCGLFSHLILWMKCHHQAFYRCGNWEFQPCWVFEQTIAQAVLDCQLMKSFFMGLQKYNECLDRFFTSRNSSPKNSHPHPHFIPNLWLTLFCNILKQWK